MEWRILLQLVIEEQVTRTRGTHIPRDEERVALPKRLCIGKLSKAAIGRIVRGVDAGAHAEQVGAKRREWVRILHDGWEWRQRLQRHGRLPSLVVSMQRTAVAPPQKGGAVVDLMRQTFGG